MLKSIARGSNHADAVLISAVIALVLLGILILASVSASFSQEKFGSSFYFLNHQILYGLIPGIMLAFLAFKTPLNTLRKWAPLLLLINLALVAMVFLPKIGVEAGGAARWISLGKITFQPSEFLKFTFILYIAAWLASRTHQSKEFGQTFIAFLSAVGLISLFLILQPDVSTLGIIASSAALMYFLANTPLWHSLLTILIGAGGLFTLIQVAPYRFNRLLVFLNPETDPMGMGYQIKHALIAIGSGGIKGSGLGLGIQRFGFLPQSISDSIFAIFAEEAGFIGSTILILLFLIFLWRGFKIARITQDRFTQLLAIGITCWICLQGFVNIASTLGILPLSGIPLPFISYGGSTLIAELVGVGILLNISKYSQ